MGTRMDSARKLYFLALVIRIHVCLSQSAVQQQVFGQQVFDTGSVSVGSFSAEVVTDAPDLLTCPIMQALPDATVLDLEIWSPMATIQVLAPERRVVTATVPTEFPTVVPTEAPANQVCLNPGQCYTITAFWTTSILTWPPKIERVLYSPDSKVIAKMTSPGFLGIPFPLDTSQEVFNCDDKLIARIVWKFEWSQLWSPGYSNARVLAAPMPGYSNDGGDIAKIVTTSQTSTGAGKIFQIQKSIQIQSPSGVEFVRMTQFFDGVNVSSLLQLAPRVTLQVGTPSADLGALVTEPYFLALVFGNQLASGLFLGPLFTLILLILILCCCCGACCHCCRGCCKKDSRDTKVSPGASPHETEPFLSEKKQQSSMFACCSRYSSAKTATGQPPTLASHAASEFRSFTGSGTA